MTDSNTSKEPDSSAIQAAITDTPRSLLDLINEDPLNLTSDDLTQIVEHLRQARRRWAAEENEAHKTGRPKKVGKGLKLDDIGDLFA